MDQFNCSDGVVLPKSFFNEMNFLDFENLNEQVKVWRNKKQRAVPVLLVINDEVFGHISNISGQQILVPDWILNNILQPDVKISIVNPWKMKTISIAQKVEVVHPLKSSPLVDY